MVGYRAPATDLAELTQHIPEKGEHLLRYFGWYSHRVRGMRAAESTQDGGKDIPGQVEPIEIDRSAIEAAKPASEGPRAGSCSTWAMLIKRVFEVDPSSAPSAVVR